jgi:hypothetical protein
MLFLAAIAHVAYGIAAIDGIDVLKRNVDEIESNGKFGDLYLSLPWWGVLLTLVGLAEFAAAMSFSRRSPQARLYGLGASLVGLAISFFTLAIFHVAALITVALTGIALYLLSYRVDD